MAHPQALNRRPQRGFLPLAEIVQVEVPRGFKAEIISSKGTGGEIICVEEGGSEKILL
tara:strand:- start:1121 stop:1294 length:174 start_codon:yes stop_codon:yes gene_type:complete